MSKRKLDNMQQNCFMDNTYKGQIINNNFIKNIDCNEQYIEQRNEQYNEQHVKKKKKTTRSNIKQIKLIVDDPSFHEYSIDDLGKLSQELSEIIEKLQSHRTHIESILNMYL